MIIPKNVSNMLTNTVFNNSRTIQLTSLFVGVIIVFCVLFVLLYQQAMPKLIRNQIELRAESIANFLAVTMLEQVATRDYLNINKLAEAVANLPEVGLAVVIDSNGEVMAGMFNNIAAFDPIIAVEIKKNGFPKNIIDQIHLFSKSRSEKYSLYVGEHEVIGYGVKVETTDVEVHVGLLTHNAIKNVQNVLIPYLLLFLITAIVTSAILFWILRAEIMYNDIARITMMLLVVFGMQSSNAAGYKLSVTPRFSAKEMFDRLGPLAKLLSENLHSQVEIILASTFQSYEENLREGQYDIAFSNPTHYAKTSMIHEAIAVEPSTNGPRMRGVIIVRSDSVINSIQDLIGHAVAIVSWESTAGFLSQKLFLEEQGIKPKLQFRLQEAHDNKQENVIFAVYHKDVAAGFINEDALHIVDKYLPDNSIRVLVKTGWIPNWALSIKRSLPKMVKEKIRDVILGLKPDDSVLTAMKVKGFVSATDSDYDVVRKALGITVVKPACTAPTVPAATVVTAATSTTPAVSIPTPVVANAVNPIAAPVAINSNATMANTTAVAAIAIAATAVATKTVATTATSATVAQPIAVNANTPAIVTVDTPAVDKPVKNKEVATTAKEQPTKKSSRKSKKRRK